MVSNRQTAIGGYQAQHTMPLEALPDKLHSKNAHRDPRYSYAETPVEMQRSTFHPLSSPTDSTIDESPMSPVLGQDLQGLPLPQVDSGYPLEKTRTVERAASPYNFPAPPQPHPAHFAPYADTGMSSQWQEHGLHPQPPQSPGPIPIKTEGEMADPVPSPIMPVTATIGQSTLNAQAVGPDLDRRPGVYNPDSLSGPNVASEAHRPGQISHPNAAVDPEWKHGLCEIDTICCLAIWCPCVLYGKTQYRLSQKANKHDATDLLGYKSCNGSCGIMALACGFQWAAAMVQHTRIRKLYHLHGEFGQDCFKSLCCCCCILMQDEREVRDREELIRRHAGPASGAYIAPQSMFYAPPPP